MKLNNEQKIIIFRKELDLPGIIIPRGDNNKIEHEDGFIKVYVNEELVFMFDDKSVLGIIDNRTSVIRNDIMYL